MCLSEYLDRLDNASHLVTLDMLSSLSIDRLRRFVTCHTATTQIRFRASQCVYEGLGEPMNCPPDDGAEDDLAAAM